MFKHPVTYTDFNGNERKEDLYFHLATHEVVRLEAEMGNGLKLEEHIQQLATNQNTNELLGFLEKVILNAYGQKTSDGKSFVKTKDIREAFEYSQAYADFFEELILDNELAKKFGENVADKSKGRKNQVAPTVINTEK